MPGQAEHDGPAGQAEHDGRADQAEYDGPVRQAGHDEAGAVHDDAGAGRGCVAHSRPKACTFQASQSLRTGVRLMRWCSTLNWSCSISRSRAR